MNIIKKSIGALLATVMALSSISPAMANDRIRVKAGGELIKFDVQPQIMNERTMVPLRAIFEALGADVEWDGNTRTITSTRKGTTISLTIDNAVMKVNEENVTLDAPACIVDGRTLVPVRAISEAFDLKVDWDGATRTVKIRKPVSLVTEDYFGYTYEYDNEGNMITLIAPDGFETRYEYDEFGNRSCLIWENSRTYYTYDENDNLLLEENTDGAWKKCEYNENGDLLYMENSYGDYRKYIYDENANLITVEDTEGILETYQYDENGNLIYKEDAYNCFEKYEYDENGNLIYQDDDEGNWSKYEYDEDGRLVKREGPDGYWNNYEYDENGNLIREIDSYGAIVSYIVMEI